MAKKMKIKVPGLLKNKYILYILLVIGIVNVLGYIALEDYNSLGLFVTVGLLSSYFSKNMSINLLLPIVITGLIAANNKIKEGMKNEDEDKTKEKMMNGNDKCKEDKDCPEGKNVILMENVFLHSKIMSHLPLQHQLIQTNLLEIE